MATLSSSNERRKSSYYTATKQTTTTIILLWYIYTMINLEFINKYIHHLCSCMFGVINICSVHETNRFILNYITNGAWSSLRSSQVGYLRSSLSVSMGGCISMHVRHMHQNEHISERLADASQIRVLSFCSWLLINYRKNKHV